MALIAAKKKGKALRVSEGDGLRGADLTLLVAGERLAAAKMIFPTLHTRKT